jgi:hypothetical protein
VKRLLFVGEAEYKDSISGSKEFADWFEAQGPKDDKGRSLRDFDLKTKIFKYNISFLIYSSDFNTLPPYAKDYVYRQIADVLEGHTHDQTYAFIPDQGRKATMQILADTKPDFARYLDTRAASNP